MLQRHPHSPFDHPPNPNSRATAATPSLPHFFHSSLLLHPSHADTQDSSSSGGLVVALMAPSRVSATAFFSSSIFLTQEKWSFFAGAVTLAPNNLVSAPLLCPSMAQHPSRCVSLSEVIVLPSPSPSLVAPLFPFLNPPLRHPSVPTVSHVQHLQRRCIDGYKGIWCTSRSKGQTLRNSGGTHLASPTRKKFAGQSVVYFAEMQGILDETTALLVKERENVKKVTVEETPVIQEKEVIVEDAIKIDELTMEVERLKVPNDYHN
ncbi:uncharacterized protein DS421_15g504740 [Arachis hypogaea]|nr:uncharacterized protein DS421_15g504740 [Arachis hypogaea]